jgi:hypothetical protein
MNRLSKIIEQLSMEDLKLLQKDLLAGNIEKLINARMQQLETRKTCPTCGHELRPEDMKFSIEFGPKDLRQRAFFDEYDCLEYFVQKMNPDQNT